MTGATGVGTIPLMAVPENWAPLRDPILRDRAERAAAQLARADEALLRALRQEAPRGWLRRPVVAPGRRASDG